MQLRDALRQYQQVVNRNSEFVVFVEMWGAQDASRIDGVIRVYRADDLTTQLMDGSGEAETLDLIEKSAKDTAQKYGLPDDGWQEYIS